MYVYIHVCTLDRQLKERDNISLRRKIKKVWYKVNYLWNLVERYVRIIQIISETLP
jgi:hypothetical protein